MTELVCENLATKAELQELRDQLNLIIGEREEGGVTEVFKAGAPIVNTAAQLAGTTYLGTKLRSLQALIDIKPVDPYFEPVWKDLATRKAQWTKVKGSGAVSRFPDMDAISKTVGNNTKTANLAAKGASTAAASVAVLSSLVNIAASLGLNIATVNIMDSRIEAEARGFNQQLDVVQRGMLNLYEKNKGKIDKVNQEIEENNQQIERVKTSIRVTESNVLETKRTNQELAKKIDNANTTIAELNQRNQELVTEINNSDIENEEAFNQLIIQTEDIQANLNQAQTTIEEQKLTIKTYETRIEDIETRLKATEEQVSTLSLSFVHLRDDFWKLQEDLKGDKTPQEWLSENPGGRVIVMEKQNTTFNGGGGGGAGVKANVEQQNKLLALTKNLSNSDIQVPEITIDDVIQNNEKFAIAFDTLIEDVDLDIMNDQQLKDLKADITNDVDNKFRLTLNDLVVPKLDDLTSPEFDRRMIDTTKTGICESLNGGSCPVTPSNPKPTQGLQGVNDALNKKADAANRALGTANLLANQSILGIVSDTNKAVRHTKYGLEKVQDFASTAWESVHGDKIMSAITTTLVVHNAIMLSNNLLQTTGEAASVTLSAIGIKDEKGNPFDVGEIVQSKVKAMLTNYLGQENYQALTKRIAAANRVYQASANILDTTQGLFDSAHTIAEITASNTGKIGNSLREAGVVYENAYDEMLEKVSPQNAAMRKLERFRQGLDSVEEGVSNISTISSEVVDIKENWTQLKKEKEDWNTEVKKATEEQQQEKDEAKQEVQVGADIQETDFDAAPLDT